MIINNRPWTNAAGPVSVVGSVPDRNDGHLYEILSYASLPRREFLHLLFHASIDFDGWEVAHLEDDGSYWVERVSKQ